MPRSSIQQTQDFLEPALPFRFELQRGGCGLNQFAQGATRRSVLGQQLWQGFNRGAFVQSQYRPLLADSRLKLGR